ncbi:MAG: tetratricopeptide repeat protein [Bacteroidota bacterium]
MQHLSRNFSHLLLGSLFFLLSASLIAQQASVDSLQQLLKQDLSDSLRVRTLVFLTEHMQFQNPAQGILYAKEAIALSDQSDNPLGKLETLSRMGGCYHNLGQLDSAEATHRQALSLAQSLDEPLHAANQMTNLGAVKESRSQLDSALHYYGIGKKAYEEAQAPIYVGIAQNNMAIVYERQGDYSRAADQYLQALAEFEAGDFPLGVSAAYTNLAKVFIAQGDYPKALEYSRVAMRYKQELSDLHGLAIVCNNLGSIHDRQEQPDSAVHYYQRALEIDRQIGNRQEEAGTLINLGMVHLEEGELQQAFGFFRPAYQLAKEVGNQSLVAKAAVYMGTLMNRQGRGKSARTYLSEGQGLAEEVGDAMLLKQVYKAWYEFYKKRGDRQAFQFYDQYISLNDSLMNDDRRQEITRLEMRYDFEQEKAAIALAQEQETLIYEAEIDRQASQTRLLIGGLVASAIILALLWRGFFLKQRTNRQLSEQKAVIQNALNEREILLQEIHHRVKNNLQVISSLLSLQSRSIQDPQALDAIQEGRNRVQAMALIHQNLYQEENLIGVDLPDYIEKLTQSLVSSYRVDQARIQLEQKIEPIPLDVDVIIPLGLILNELITNALKYAFADRDEGTIAVEIQEDPRGIRVQVADDGQGLPQNFDPDTPSTLGFKLVRSFVQKMNGSLEVQSEQGTVVRLWLPGKVA